MLLDDVTESIARDRYAFVSCFLRDYYNVARIGVDRVSNDVVVASGNAAARASATALEQCVRASMIDFRNDLVAIDVPALVLHGDDDWILPIVSTGLQLHRDLPGSRFVAIEGGAHGLLWTHHDEVNRELLAFLRSHMRNAVK
jgi:non-heme chloroperoxidase